MSNTIQPRGGQFIYNQPWSTGLCDCCSDVSTCLCAVFCTPCFLCDLDKDAGECCMTSNMCGIFSLSVLRGKIRGHYGIEGGIWKDVCSLYWFPCCSAIQMKNELLAHGID